MNNQNYQRRDFNNLKENQPYNINIENSVYLNRLTSKMNDQLKINSSIMSKDQDKSIKNSAIKCPNISYTDQNKSCFTDKFNFESSHLNPNQFLNNPRNNLCSQSSISSKSSQMEFFTSQNHLQCNKPDIFLPGKNKKGGKNNTKAANQNSKVSSQSSKFVREADENYFEECDEDFLYNNLNVPDKNLPDIYRDTNYFNPNDIPTHKDDVNILHFDDISVDKIANLIFISGLQFTQAYSQSNLDEIIFEGLIPANNTLAFKFKLSDCKVGRSHVMFYTKEYLRKIQGLSVSERCKVNSIRLYQIICQTSGFVGIYILLGI